MVFSSLSFLYFFLPLVCILYFLCKNRVYRNVVLLAASLFFYAWGERARIIWMLLSTLVAYLGGLGMAWLDRRGCRGAKRMVLIGSIVLITASLFVFKYFGFFASNLESLFRAEWEIPALLMPIGISFYTFQILSYVIDLYRNEVRLQRNFFYLLLYVSFFPQLIAGPIVRYQTVEEEILSRKETLPDVMAGLRRFIIGLAKKVLIANQVGAVADTIFAGDPAVFGGAMYWFAAIAYALQIYFDFSGYSDMAIGLGRMFGFHFLENFNQPYCATSITDFWRRWHISLSSWFRDYIYIPLGGNRVSRGRWVLNILIVWGVTGFWHGASWNFIFWGLYYGLLLLIEKFWVGRLLKRLPVWVSRVYTWFFVLIGWVFFYMTDLTQLGTTLRTLFILPRTDWLGVLTGNLELLRGGIFVLLGILCCIPWKKPDLSRWGIMGDVLSYGVQALLLLLCVMSILSTKYNPFIYFRF